MAFALLLSAARLTCEGDRHVRAGRWHDGALRFGVRVNRKRLGIVGLGRIGRVVAERAGGFAMEVHYHEPRRMTDVAYRYHAEPTELARAVDFLVVTCASGPETDGLIDAPVLEALGSGGVLVNMARRAVDEAALIEALKGGVIAGAALDTFAHEPGVPDALTAMENVVLQATWAPRRGRPSAPSPPRRRPTWLPISPARRCPTRCHERSPPDDGRQAGNSGHSHVRPPSAAGAGGALRRPPAATGRRPRRLRRRYRGTHPRLGGKHLRRRRCQFDRLAAQPGDRRQRRRPLRQHGRGRGTRAWPVHDLHAPAHHRGRGRSRRLAAPPRGAAHLRGRPVRARRRLVARRHGLRRAGPRQKLGIVGLGEIGRAVGRRAEAFDLDVSYNGPRRKDDVSYRYYADLAEMAAAVDSWR